MQSILILYNYYLKCLATRIKPSTMSLKTRNHIEAGVEVETEAEIETETAAETEAEVSNPPRDMTNNSRTWKR